MNKKYFIYTRISDDKYEKSIDNQEDIIKKLAKRDWIDESDLIIKSEIKSWKKWSEREAFNEIIKELETDEKRNWKKIDNRTYWWIYFFKIDRLARNDADFQKIFNLLDAWYIFKSVTETIENTPTWRLLFRMLSSFAIFESEKLWNRESIANIHNIILKRFRNLWWKTIIFWYELYWKDKKIRVNKNEKEMILDIYDLFIQSKEWIHDKKLTYKEIFDIVDSKHWGYLLNYITKESTIANKDNFISNILNNNKMIKYNWYIDRSLNINDELIKNYIDTIIDKKDNYYEIIWLNKIWWKVKFSFFFDDLIILSDILYNKVQEYLNESKNINPERRSKIYCWLFENILFFNKNNELYEVPEPYKTKKDTYQYRKTVDWKSYEISEIQWIENKIKASWIVDRIIKLENSKIVSIKENLEGIEKELNKSDLQKLVWTKNLYKHFVDRYKFLSENEKNVKMINYYIKEKNIYQKNIDEIDREINLIKSEKDIDIERFIEFFTLKNFFSSDKYIRRDFYLTFFEKIIYDEEKNIKIILNDYLVDVWLKKEISI